MTLIKILKNRETLKRVLRRSIRTPLESPMDRVTFCNIKNLSRAQRGGQNPVWARRMRRVARAVRELDFVKALFGYFLALSKSNKEKTIHLIRVFSGKV